jgi:glycosyltransferase involved in cell wall biosynthesis
MLKIGIDIRNLMSPTRNGVGEYTYELLNAIFKIDKENQYYLFYNSHTDVTAHTPLWPQNNIHYVATRWPNKVFNGFIKIFGWPKLDKLVSRHGKLDYFFSPNLNFTALSKDIKNILTIHDLSFKFFPQFFSVKQKLWHWAVSPKKQCERANAILVLSQNTKRDLVDYYKIPQEKIKIVPGAISTTFNSPATDKEKIKQKYNLPNRFILCLGAVEPRKNIIGLIDAFEKIYHQLPASYSLVIAGSGHGWKNKQIYARALASPLRDKIEFIGYVDAEDKPGLYSLAELFVYPSFYEGFGFPVLEAMAMGVPVITSNRSSLPEITDQATYLVSPNHPTEIAQAMIKMLTNEKLREYFKKLGLEQVKKFSWDTAAKEFLSLI